MELLLTPTGTLQWNQAKALKGYTLICPSFSKKSYLIDMEGDIVHEWSHDSLPGLYGELLPNGNLLRGKKAENAVLKFGGYGGGGVEEIDWEGNVVWSFDLCDDKHIHHHCFKRLANGNTFLLGWEQKTREEAIAKGRRPETLPEEGFTALDGSHSHGICPDYLLEVAPSGKVVWEWHVWDHIGTGENEFDINFRLPSNATMGDMAYADWTHFNTIDYDPKRDVILLNSRNFSEFYLIDHKSGDMLYRWGNPTTHGKGKPPTFGDDGDQILFGAHCPQFLENGNILLFDNGWLRPQMNRSRALEMNPDSGEIVWTFQSRNPNGFSSPFQGATQRLPNGNTLITSTNAGQIFEVTREKEIVWVFVNPWAWQGVSKRVLYDQTDTHPLGQDFSAGIQFNMVHRSYRYGAEYSGLRGKDLNKIRRCTDGPYWYKEFEAYGFQDRINAEMAAKAAASSK